MAPTAATMLLTGAIAACSAAAAAAGGGAPKRPNIIFVMSDDQDGNRVRQDYADYLPMHRYLRDHGTTFVNHCADSPQCGPSRAATLSGRLPHNTGFLENGDTTGASVASWMRLRNQTIGTFLTRAGYHTAFAGKWVNGDACNSMPLENDGSPTWSSWAQLCNTYILYNSSYADPAAPGGLRIETGIHQSDSLAIQAASQMHLAIAAGKPFYLHWTPVAPHESTCHGCDGRDRAACAALYPQDGGEVGDDGGENYGLFGRPCPAIRHRGLFLNLTMPRNPSWNRSSNAPVSFTAFAKFLSAVRYSSRARLGKSSSFSKSLNMRKFRHSKHSRCWSRRTNRSRSTAPGSLGSRRLCLSTRWSERSLLRSEHAIVAPFNAKIDWTDIDLGKTRRKSGFFLQVKSLGVEDSTYFFYTSDNGWHLGEHLLAPFNKVRHTDFCSIS